MGIGRDGKEKEGLDCIQIDIPSFGIMGDWKVTTLKAEVWVEKATKDRQRFMAAWKR